MRHFHVSPNRRSKWGLGGQAVTIPPGYVTPTSASQYQALSVSGRTISGPNGWSVTVPPNTYKILPPYSGLLDMISGNCPAISSEDGTSVSAVQQFFNISASDMAALEAYAASIGAPCPTAANPNPTMPGVMTQAQVQQAISATPVATAPPSFVATDIALANNSPSDTVAPWGDTANDLLGTSSASGTAGTVAPTVATGSDDTLWLAAAVLIGAVILFGGK